FEQHCHQTGRRGRIGPCIGDFLQSADWVPSFRTSCARRVRRRVAVIRRETVLFRRGGGVASRQMVLRRARGGPSDSGGRTATLEELRRLTGGTAGATKAEPGAAAGTDRMASVLVLRGVATIAEAGADHVTWAAEKRHAGALAISKAG